MFVITLDGFEEEGAYSVTDKNGDNILYIFEEEDDAVRFAMMLENDRNYPTMNVVEVDDETVIYACNMYGYKYSIFTSNDIVIPPEQSD